MFLAEKGQEEIDRVAKVLRLSQIAIDLKKKVKELKAQERPSTPPEVLEKQKKTTSEAVDRINKGEKLYTEAIDVVLEIWELLLEDETTTKFTEDMHQTELKIIAVEEDMKKLPIKENIAKVVLLK